MNSLSIIIPIYNEALNLRRLILRIHTVATAQKIPYEIIFIDDHSTDETLTLLSQLPSIFCVKYFLKIGKKGKAQSLLEGFKYAKNDTIVIIDGDQQYPPEAIPAMLKKIQNGADIVIARRDYQNENKLRHLSHNLFCFVFGKVIHGFSYDVQSGLKMFKRKILDRVQLHPRSGWMFDLDFLIQARNAGFMIAETPINFVKRTHGVSKINMISALLEMIRDSLWYKWKDTGIVALDKETRYKKGNGFHHRGKLYVHHTELNIEDSAFKRFNRIQIFILIFCLLAFSAFFIFNAHVFVVILISVITILYFLDLLYLFYLVLISVTYDPAIKISDSEINSLSDEDLPTYTVLCPLYKEWKVLPQFITSISKMDYPKHKLQVLILLEEDDLKSREEITQMNLPYYFDLVIVPDSQPKTKPKALNYGLKFTKGKYLVIYDAEDAPEPDQLKKALFAFRTLPRNVICVQAKLQYYNPEQNILTRLFAVEYLLWFDLILPGLQSIRAPIPLGGTSNHFRTRLIKRLRGWDSFNVTEDADLGIRLFKKGFRTEIIDSVTLEEANSSIPNWINQRSRWIKGYIQTYFVHLRRPKEIALDFFNPHILTFHLVMGWKSFFLLINPLLWLLTISYFLFRPQIGGLIESFFPMPILYIGSFVLLTGNFLYTYMYLIALGKRSLWHMAFYMIFVPLYWLLMSYAAVLALKEFIVKPHHWNKTVHGLHFKYMEEIMTNSSVPIETEIVHI